MDHVNTAEDFFRIRSEVKPATIQSKTHGTIPVPCTMTLLVRKELVVANSYNPNSVSGDKMQLLRQSILDNGFCFPIVTIWDDEAQHFVIIDGFHRSLIGGAEWLDVDYLPIVVLSHNITRRMAATVQFNKAKGTHEIDRDADVVRALMEQGLSEEEVSVKLGLELDAVHRYKQVTGVAELFARSDYSTAWSIVEDDEPRANSV